MKWLGGEIFDGQNDAVRRGCSFQSTCFQIGYPFRTAGSVSFAWQAHKTRYCVDHSESNLGEEDYAQKIVE